MKSKVKQLWLDALRGKRVSSLGKKYKQGQGCLFDGKEFCCLGVLTDLYIQEHKRSRWGVDEDSAPNLKDDGVFPVFNNKRCRNFSTLSDVVMKWAGLSSEDPFFDGPDATASDLNDSCSSFKTIAKLIEEEL